ncbi:glutathione S-transferase N-terminal domain-containing protein [Rhizobium calliandrae]|uniref:Glutathione S-transferase N-terminal domain-containing protein n=1 Tax=Rhizobium calliandrae TaxID=1312182 RepID=A0ABT7K851_9HYPH|nr:glutathione S-transferase N-terminal domain-containing protein [Rhizobium calliandrae]MDL2404342.1 glutathione S-transferase N-terminal domain-containing protein [Rhizobium calliandrae]
MLELYAFATPNSVKIPIALEELGLAYELKPINVRRGEQRDMSFLTLNPNGKVPVLVDPNGPDGKPLTLSESAAILIYLAEKTGRLLPVAGAARARVFEQLFFDASALGPAFGQAGFFKRSDEKLPLAIKRFDTEARRVLSVLDGVLARSFYVAGDGLTIADIAHFGWLWRREFSGIDLAEAPDVARWYETMKGRPSVVRAIARLNGASG